MEQLCKRKLIIIVMFGLLMLTACNNETNSNQHHDENDGNNNQEENEDVEENNFQEENEEVEGNDHQSKENQEQARTEEGSDANDLDEDGTKEFRSMTFSVLENDEEIGTFEVDLTHPDKDYDINDDVKVVLSEYFPDYEMVDAEPMSQSQIPYNPAFIFKIVNDSREEVVFLGIGKNIGGEPDQVFKLELIDYTMRD